MTLGLVLAAGSAGECPNPARCPHQGHHHHHNGSGGFILPPGPGDGWGFPNGDPNGAGWYDPAPYLPLGADRTSDYFFPRYYAVPPQQMFLSTYYNAYENKGQRYLPYTGAGGDHPMGAPLWTPRSRPCSLTARSTIRSR
ncbi:hypothetical protein [Paludisphaera borealis]|nr:hypothetical protein [Paludisphaera borealis]